VLGRKHLLDCCERYGWNVGVSTVLDSFARALLGRLISSSWMLKSQLWIIATGCNRGLLAGIPTGLSEARVWLLRSGPARV
jgi:hypothetical protein